MVQNRPFSYAYPAFLVEANWLDEDHWSNVKLIIRVNGDDVNFGSGNSTKVNRSSNVGGKADQIDGPFNGGRESSALRLQ